VRGYLALGISTDTLLDPPQTFNANRAFIQWAGFTFGRAQSFFDFYSQAAVGYLGFAPNSDTGDGGWEVLGYTAQLGNGFSASLSLEARRTTQLIGAIGTAITGGGSINGGAASVVRAYPAVPTVTPAGRFLTSSPICASTRLGVLLQSRVPCTRSMHPITSTPQVLLIRKVAVTPMMNGAGQSWRVCG
jgi:hypothetical protein